ncbi:MAG: hypothetical protein M5U19_19620 [Microthrixaceae bacterium]|nr:hypothetical protein [Microthrixaceae bacterium]
MASAIVVPPNAYITRHASGMNPVYLPGIPGTGCGVVSVEMSRGTSWASVHGVSNTTETLVDNPLGRQTEA